MPAFEVKRYISHGSLGKEVRRLGQAFDDATGVAVADLATADASAQTGSYVQADVESIRTLANATKAKLNALLDSLRDAGIIAT